MEYLTIKDVCELLQVHRNTITKLCNEGLPFVNIGGRKRFVADSIKQWMLGQQEINVKKPVENTIVKTAKKPGRKPGRKAKKPVNIRVDAIGDKNLKVKSEADKLYEEWKEKQGL